MTTIDLEHLLKLRVVVARVGEMDLAKWWNTNGQLGRYGDAAVRRGLPRTHSFAQARSVAAVAANRCDEVFSLANTVTLWRLPASVEERYEARWEHWLDNAAEWRWFFEEVSALDTTDVRAALQHFHIGAEDGYEVIERAELGPGGRSLELPGPFTGTPYELEQLALGFRRGAVGSLTVPYAKLGDS